MATKTHSHAASQQQTGDHHDSRRDSGAAHSHGDHAAAGDGGHGAHGHGHGDHAEMFRRRFWWSLLLTIPVVVTSHMVMGWFNYDLDFAGMGLVGPVLGSVVYFWAGWPFLVGGWQEVRSRRPGMMLLITLAITVAYVASLISSLDWFDLEFWWELAALITIMLLGHWQEMKARGQAQSALAALAALLPDEAERVASNGEIETVTVDELRVDDVVLVRPGGRVPADGAIIDGEAELDESMVTGESRPVAKHIGDRVVAGTVSTDSSIRLRIEAVGEQTALAGIQRLVAEAQESHSRAQALADRFAALLFYVAVGSAIVTFVVWSLLGDMDDAVTNTVTVLVIACPHALGLAIPLVISLSTAVGARSGILIKNRLALEGMRTVDTILFDKTGTLTKGQHTVTGVVGVEISETEVLRLAGGVESDSEHPLARAIVAAAKERADVATAVDFRSLPGRGVEAIIDSKHYAVGGPALLRERRIDEPEAIRAQIEEWKQRGAAVLFLVEDQHIIGALALEDEIRPEAREAVATLRSMGRRVVLITGDAQQVAESVGRELGVDEVMAEVLPEDKDAKVAELHGRGLSVAMVGDGVNDAPALARANVGIAIGAGTDVAIESADVVLASNDPRAVVSLIELSKASYRKMIQNLAWAGGYNIVAIPLAAGALAWAGFTLPPAVGAVLMSLSTIVVALNAQLLRGLDLRPTSPVADHHEPSSPHRYRSAHAGRIVGIAALVIAVLAIGTVVLLNRNDNAKETIMSPAGTTSTVDGYTLQVATTELPALVAAPFRFRIVNADGQAVSEYDVNHEKELHLIVASHDLTTYQHVHPERSSDGTWAVTLSPLKPGAYRAFADFIPKGGPDLTLGSDVTVTGAYQPAATPPPAGQTTIDGYEVTLGGTTHAATESEVTLTVRHNGLPVADLDPYLGALGHLVALRSTDMAYLHVHPLENTSGTKGPEVRFAVHVPSTGTYRLYFDFSHNGTVRTAAFTVEVSASGEADQNEGHGGH